MTCGSYYPNLYTPEQNAQIFIIKTDSRGNILWSKEMGDSEHNEIAEVIRQNNDGTFIIAASYCTTYSSLPDLQVIKVDQKGDFVWSRIFQTSGVGMGLNIVKDLNDDNIITGDNDAGIFLTRMDNNGFFK
jgi:hypothetical protein